MREIVEFLSRVGVGSPLSHRNLVVVPLFGPLSGPVVVSLVEAIRRGGVDVTEVDEHGKVGEVKVTNRCISHLLLFGGEELLGGKQNRIVNTTVVIAPGETVHVPVSCVEHGRWKWNDRRFRAAGRAVPPRMRAANAEGLTTTLELSGVWQVGQQRVWDDVANITQRLHAHAPTMALDDAVTPMAERIEEFVQALRPLPGQTGLSAYVNGTLVSLDLLGRPEAYAEVHDLLLRSCAVEAIERGEQTEAPSRVLPQVVLSELSDTTAIAYPSPSHGVDIRLRREGLQGSALVASDGVVHLSAFPTGR